MTTDRGNLQEQRYRRLGLDAAELQLELEHVAAALAALGWRPPDAPDVWADQLTLAARTLGEVVERANEEMAAERDRDGPDVGRVGRGPDRVQGAT